MKRNLSLTATVSASITLAFLLFQVLATAQQPTRISKDTAAKMIAKARDTISLSLVGPVRIEANLKFTAPNAKVKGTYVLDWAAPDRFRREIHLPGYDEISVATGRALFRKRNTNYTPLLAYRAKEMMSENATIAQFQSDASRAALAVPANATAFAVGASQTSAFAATVMTVRGETCLSLVTNFFEQLCMGKDDNLPVAISLHNTGDTEGLRYEDYKSFGSGVISRKRKYLDGGTVLAEADIKHMEKVVDFPPDTFVAPANAEQVEWCSDESPAALLPLKPPLPVTVGDFPNPEILDAFVSADGKPTRLEILATGGPAADAAARKLAYLIRFAPATCGGKAVASEMPLVLDASDTVEANLKDTNGIPLAGTKGNTLPQCIYCPTPRYSSEGFHAKIQGEVVLDAVIGPDGRAHNIRVVKALGHGLDEEAIRAMRDSWRFKPANGPDGKPAAVRMLVEIQFHLY